MIDAHNCKLFKLYKVFVRLIHEMIFETCDRNSIQWNKADYQIQNHLNTSRRSMSFD